MTREQTEVTRNASGTSPPRANTRSIEDKVTDVAEATARTCTHSNEPEFACEPCLDAAVSTFWDRFDASLTMKTIKAATLLKRINRKLAHENQAMRKARTWTTDLGWYYLVDLHTGNVESTDQDIVGFALEEGLIKTSELVEDGTASTEVA